MRGVRRLRAYARGRPARLLRPLRPPAPRPGVGRNRHLRGRAHHRPARARTGLAGLRRGEAARARGRHGDRARPLLDYRRRRLGERAAGLARRRARAGARPQRQPDQRGRALQRVARARPPVPRDVGLGDHGGAPVQPRGPDDRGRRRRDDAEARGRLLDRGDDQARRGRLPRPLRGAAALAGAARRPLRGRLGELRLRHHRRRADPRGLAGGARVADGRGTRVTPGGALGAAGVLRLRAHLLLASRQPARGAGAPAGARPDGRDPRPRGAGRRRPGDLGARLRQPGGERVRARVGPPQGRRADQEPLRRADLHPAGSGAAKARPADEVQPAAGDRLGQARRRGRRLDRARQYDQADRRHAQGRGRERGPPADLRPPDPPSLPLRDRHVDPRGDDRARPDRGGRSRRSWGPTRSPTSPSTGSTRRSGPRASRTATPASPASTRSGRRRRRTGSSPSSSSSRSPARAEIPTGPPAGGRLGPGCGESG